MMDGVKETLKLLAENNDPKFWYKHLVESMKQITPEEFMEAVNSNRNIMLDFLDHNYMKIPLVEERVREILRVNWHFIEDFLKDPNNIINALKENEELVKSGVLEKEETYEYIVNMSMHTYYTLREFVFQERQKILKLLETKPEIPLRQLLEIAPLVGVHPEMASKILENLNEQGVVEIVVRRRRV